MRPTQQAPKEANTVFSNKENSAPTPRKSHKNDDQAALMELRARREAKSKNPRLPNWAKEAVASQGRSTPSTSASPAPAAAPVRRAKNPFQ
ncbi:hypothetical protein PFICI_11510 [Pestalotiopsis fici W106-1]|uniref:Uncharacterized protein n=1 Tax=Pestalotiopsis fici (strain W106-1 / CGMCC3.15140) TaxID=1229662 RepID=W3WQJ9_PESFW|nr:uncharacterized protein PFICI_11510 [Pestalotiopsis fici W106-1]ETS76123.1 hypothetical protein PFICI_11510 [Pestalotiopsis fici W106-1]